MKKDFHGFELEMVDMPIENIITASSTFHCNYSNNYGDAPAGMPDGLYFYCISLPDPIGDRFFWFGNKS